MVPTKYCSKPFRMGADERQEQDSHVFSLCSPREKNLILVL